MFFNAPFLIKAPVDFHAANLQEPCSKIQNRGSLLGGIEREITMVWCVPIFSFARGIVSELGCKMVFMFLSIPNRRVKAVGISLPPAKGRQGLGGL